MIINVFFHCVCLYASEEPRHSFNAQLVCTTDIVSLPNRNEEGFSSPYELIGIPYDKDRDILFLRVQSVKIRDYKGDIVDWTEKPPLMRSRNCFANKNFFLADSVFPLYVPYAWLFDNQGKLKKGEVTAVSQAPEKSIVYFTLFSTPELVRKIDM